MNLFVFGTVKKGFALHAPTLDGALYIGNYRTVLPYPMLIAGPWFAPMMLLEPGAGHRVRGELYHVDEAHLRRIDAVESVGIPGNHRIEIEVEPLDGGRPVLAFAYAKSAELATPMHSEFLEDYQDRRFVPPWYRTQPTT
jgi:gamma-glutamylaminecyclotransferase